MKGTIFHTLKGIKGWSQFNISTIDICKIKDIYYEKRLFCIFNKNHPYTLTIEYCEPTQSYGLVRGATFDGKFTTTLVSQIDLTTFMTRRYKSEIEVMNEIEEIKTKQKKIELLKIKFANQLIEM